MLHLLLPRKPHSLEDSCSLTFEENVWRFDNGFSWDGWKTGIKQLKFPLHGKLQLRTNGQQPCDEAEYYAAGSRFPVLCDATS